MNYLRSLKQNLQSKRSSFKTNYLRNSDSGALKSSEFKNLVPYVGYFQYLKFSNFNIVSKENHSNRLDRRGKGGRFAISLLQRRRSESLCLEIYVLFQEHLLGEHQWKKFDVCDGPHQSRKILDAQI